MAFHSQDADDAITQINVVPLVDIMLVLLIIFMLTTSFITATSVPVSLPKALTANPNAPASRGLVLTKEGSIYYQNRPIGKDQVTAVLKQDLLADPELRIVLSADDSVTHGRVVELLDLVRQAGITKVALGVAKK